MGWCWTLRRLGMESAAARRMQPTKTVLLARPRQGEVARIGESFEANNNGGHNGSGRRSREEEPESRSGSDNLEGVSGDDQDAADDKPPRKKRYHRHTPQQIQEFEAWQTLENNWCFHFVHWFLNLSYVVLSSKVVRIVASNPSLVIALVASTLVCFVHPALGLFLLLLSHAVCCQNALSSHIQTKELRVSGNEQLNNSRQPIPKYNGETSKHVPLEENSPTSLENAKSYADTQLEIFHHRNSVSKVSSKLLIRKLVREITQEAAEAEAMDFKTIPERRCCGTSRGG
nr:homeobox-leucine zipper protein ANTHOCYANINLESS 2-like [Ipomoea batatas]